MGEQCAMVDVSGSVQPTSRDCLNAHAIIHFQPRARFKAHRFKPEIVSLRPASSSHKYFIGDNGFATIQGELHVPIYIPLNATNGCSGQNRYAPSLKGALQDSAGKRLRVWNEPRSALDDRDLLSPE